MAASTIIADALPSNSGAPARTSSSAPSTSSLMRISPFRLRAAATSTSSEGMTGVTEEDLLAAPPPNGPEPAAHEVRRVDKHAARIPATVVVTRDYGYRQRVRRYRVPIVLRDRGCRASHQHHGHHRHHGHRYACSHGGQAYVGHAHHSHHFHGNFVLGFYFRF